MSYIGLANIMTISRIPLTLILSLLLINIETRAYAVIIFCLAICTDYLDGAIARYSKTTSEWGAIMDPVCDKILIICTLYMSTIIGLIPTQHCIAVIIIIIREIFILGIRIHYISLKDNKTHQLSAIWVAKLKTILQMLAVLCVLMSLVHFDNIWITQMLLSLGYMLLWLSVIFAIYSLKSYLYLYQ